MKQCREKLKKLRSVFCLGCQFLGLCLLQLRDAGCGFGAHDAMKTVNTNIYLLVSVIVVGLDGFHKLGKCTFILTGETKNKASQYSINFMEIKLLTISKSFYESTFNSMYCVSDFK
uniref:Uncharacterized protein n=1 Tax=Acanthochromis polyacanthus TaxID=80966 RepID=A0A3Q1GK18_9TELE